MPNVSFPVTQGGRFHHALTILQFIYLQVSFAQIQTVLHCVRQFQINAWPI